MELVGSDAPVTLSLCSALDYADRSPKHRYEKELNGGARPVLHLITTRDTSTGLHTVSISGATVSSQLSVLDISSFAWTHIPRGV